MKNYKNKILAAVGVLLVIGIIAQGIENSLDKNAIKSYAEKNLIEDDKDSNEGHINFERDNGKENTIFEWIGF